MVRAFGQARCLILIALYVQATATSGLAQQSTNPPIDSANEQLVRRLMERLHDPIDTVRLQTAKELGRLGPAAKEAVFSLQNALHDSDIDVRQMAAAALARIRPAHQESGGRPDVFMLAVGIDRYQAPVNNLSGCVNDALGMAKLFQGQGGKQYGQVQVQTLIDAAATQDRITAGLDWMRRSGKAGDWYVIVLSGHGKLQLHRWGFVAHDGRSLTDTVLLEWADELATADKNVLVIIDACFAGQLRYQAHAVLNRHHHPHKGGIILATSSMPAQTSAALQSYSAFARAFEEGLAGLADYDRNQSITLAELRRFTYNRVYELCLQKRALPGFTVETQDSAIDSSLSISETTPLAQASRSILRETDDDGPSYSLPQGTWTTTANGAGDPSPAGALTYRLRLHNNGVFRASLGDGKRTQRLGEGIFKSTSKTLRLVHKQGTDRLEIVAASPEELRIRFQGREIALRREFPARGSIADTIWSGAETLSGFGSLTFQFESDGAAVMIDAKSTVQGTWTQNGNLVTIAFQNCTYEGQLLGDVLSGTARYTVGAGAWGFTVTQQAPKTTAPPP